MVPGGSPMHPCLLIDLDGVVRFWDSELVALVERRHGLPAGSIAAAAFEAGSALRDAVTGRITDQEWRADVASRLARLCEESASTVVAEWAEHIGSVDTDVLAVVRTARRTGWRVGLLTNATTRLADDLSTLGIADEFDVVISSADLGIAKPDPCVFQTAYRLMSVDARACVFVDDTEANVVAARQVGLDAHLFTDADSLAELLLSRQNPAGQDMSKCDDPHPAQPNACEER
jgi:putative hydrolase of the HAD superfamily